MRNLVFRDLRLPRLGAMRAGGFSPAVLFASDEPGVWYDPSDLTTIFQDTAGTTPVTTPGQTVGLMLDKSGNGFHATQDTAASRPTYGIVPATGRRNLLTYSERADDSAWTKVGASVTANVITSPGGTLTADKITENATFSTHILQRLLTFTAGVTYTWSAFLKQEEVRYSQLWFGTINAGASFDLLNGTASGVTGFNAPDSFSITDAGDGWYRCSVTYTSPSSTSGNVSIYLSQDGDFANRTYTGDGTSGLYVWGAQLEVGSTATDYQRVGTQYDVTEAGVQSLGYLAFDGVDDFMVTPTITPGTDKVQVFAGVRKLSDAAQGVVAEMSATIASNNGALLLAAPDAASATFAFDSKGTTQADAVATGQTAPLTAVLSGLGDIAGDSAAIRVSGALVDTDTADQGTGNYLAYPMYIGRRGGTSLPFNGHLYSLITRFGDNLSADVISRSESYTAQKTGVVL